MAIINHKSYLFETFPTKSGSTDFELASSFLDTSISVRNVSFTRGISGFVPRTGNIVNLVRRRTAFPISPNEFGEDLNDGFTTFTSSIDSENKVFFNQKTLNSVSNQNVKVVRSDADTTGERFTTEVWQASDREFFIFPTVFVSDTFLRNTTLRTNQIGTSLIPKISRIKSIGNVELNWTLGVSPQVSNVSPFIFDHTKPFIFYEVHHDGNAIIEGFDWVKTISYVHPDYGIMYASYAYKQTEYRELLPAPNQSSGVLIPFLGNKTIFLNQARDFSKDEYTEDGKLIATTSDIFLKSFSGFAEKLFPFTASFTWQYYVVKRTRVVKGQSFQTSADNIISDDEEFIKYDGINQFVLNGNDPPPSDLLVDTRRIPELTESFNPDLEQTTFIDYSLRLEQVEEDDPYSGVSQFKFISAQNAYPEMWTNYFSLFNDGTTI